MFALWMRRTGVAAICVFAGVFGAFSAGAQVVFDAASNATPATASTANPITVTWNHTVGLAKKPYIVVGVSIDRNAGAQTVTTVTYGTEAGGPNLAMTLIGAVNNGTAVRAELWGLAAPTAGTHQISVVVANAGGQNTGIVAGAKSFTNVFQTASLGTAATATGTSTTPSVAVTNTPFDYVVDAVAFNGNNALTATAGQTNPYNLTSAAPAFSGAGSIKTSAANTTMSWTAGASQAWATVAAPLKSANPQIMFDAASSTSFANNTATFTGSWNHTTTTAANRYLVVGVSIDEGGGATTVTGVRYGTEGGGPNVAMTSLGVQANGTVDRVELWGLVAPASGTHQITVTMGNNTGTRNTNVIAGAQTFSGIDQSAPTGTFVSATGNTATPTVNVTNSAYDYVVDAYAWNANTVLTTGTRQDSRYNINTAAAAPVTNFAGGGSGLRGYTNATMSWTQGGGGQQWAIAAIPLKQVTVALNKSASADVIKLGQTVTYTLTATNYSSATATNVTITDAIPSGSAFVSQTGCSGTGPVSCNIGSLASGATSAPITITVVGTSAGTIANVATLTYTGAATAISSETVKTIVEAKVCASPGKDGVGGTLAGIKNDYWPGSASVAAGATSITVGARAGGGAGNSITAGDLLIVMQMQDAAFDTTNDETYGEGTGSTRGTGTGSGAATTLNNAGRWEYVVATNTIGAAGGALTVSGGGAGGGLLYAYTNQNFAATTTQGQRTFQVIRVPQYTTATLGSTLTALAWNGATGGVLAVDVSGTLALGGATVSVNGLGFRGGAGRILTGDATAGLANTDFRTLATLTTNGSKGEGIAGTPRYVYQSGATIGTPGTNAALDTGVEGYAGGSYGRGAPGNAGGGSTDGDPPANDDNSGGGGGGNGGFGGAGGNAWNANVPSGGQGGGGISPSLTRITMGGGGGAGTSNNGSAADATGTVLADGTAAANGYYSSGANGGGVIIIRALQATGTGTLTANGFNAANTGRDGSGGGGAGGSILLTTQLGTLSGLTVQAKGGNGGNAWLLQAPGGDPGERHGPGGGGGGGYILVSSAPLSSDVSGGTNGVTTTANDRYGAQPGTAGIVQTVLGNNVLPGGDGATCAVADLMVTNTAPAVVQAGNNITYTQTVSNNGPNTADGVVYTAPIPASSSFVSMSVPPGWTCITPAVGGTGVVTCTTSSLANGATANFSLVVNSYQGTPAGYIISETNSVSSNTPDSNPANNQATATTIAEAAVDADLFADMAVTISQSTNYPTAGSNISYTQTISNLGSFTAQTPTYSFTTPPNTTFQALTPPAGWTCITPAVNGTGTITCSGSTLASGASVNMPLTLKVNAGTAAGTTITATPTVGSSSREPYLPNNTASVTSTVVAAGSGDVSVTISNLPTPVSPAENYTYTVVASNGGPNAAANISVAIPLPAGTNFQSLTPPAGWSCSTPAVGSGGTITCTIASLAANANATFSPVVQVNAGTAAGTTLNITSTITTTSTDSIAANNSSSTSNLVVAASNADISIVKTDSPDPLGQGQLITYRLAVTNNGPATATNVTVSDSLHASLTLNSAIPSIGSCSGTTTINCSLGTLPVGNTQYITIIVQATATGTIPNTATASATETDPIPGNNSSTVNTTVLAVTLVRLRTLAVTQEKNRVQITWQTSFESDNLGFNVYRDVGGVRTKVNKTLIAGTALKTKKDDNDAVHSYRLRDKLDSASTFAQYWLEDVDTHGVHTMHGPTSPSFGAVGDEPSSATPLPGLGQQGSVLESQPGVGVLRDLSLGTTDNKALASQQDLAADSGLKIYVTKEGWQHVTTAAMSAAGFDGSDSKHLSLFRNGVEVPMVIDADGISFYGIPLDTPATGARTYWLRAKGNANRIDTNRGKGGDPITGDVSFTYARTERSVYFAGLTNNGEQDNMFGPIITTEPTTQSFTLAGVDTASALNATLEIVMQGGSTIAHATDVTINGHLLTPPMISLGQAQQTYTFAIPHSYLVNGTNNLVLTARNGDDDISVLVTTRVTYQHVLRADGGALEVNLPGGRAVTIGGFPSNSVKAFDVTDPQNPISLDVTTATDPQGGFKATFAIPSGAGAHTIYAADASRTVTLQELALNKPSTWSANNTKGGNLVIITNSAFTSAATSLASLRTQQGISSAVVDVDDVYDEYNFGTRDPKAIRAFLQDAVKSWKTPPRWVVLLGDASLDPRNYLGAGASDYVPTKIVITALLKTASDGWFTDFNNDGIEDIPIGRIPAGSAADATSMVARITSRGTPSGAWSNSVLFVADTPNTYDFPGVASSLKAMLPPSFASQTIRYDQSANPHGDTISAISSGQLVVDYVGHGSAEIWSDGNFASSDAASLSNGSKLPVAILMTCLNGYFHDPFSQSVAEALMLAPNGGAVGVWASSGLTEPDQQAAMNRELFRQLLNNANLTLGEAIVRAKAVVTDKDVKTTWIWFGDPSMKVK